MPKQIITAGSNFPLQPSHIHIGQGFTKFWDAFGNSETETSAYYVVKLYQELGGWIPFTHEQIEELYSRSGRNKGFTFNRLVEPGRKVLNAAAVFAGDLPRTEPIGGGWIVLGEDNKYYVTDDFVARCFRSSPATRFETATS